LSLKLLALTVPGVPDVYQGSELWETSLVDPDNRRPVDFAVRRRLLEEIDAGAQPPVDETGAAKLLVTTRALRLRRDAAKRFSGYTPVAATGAAADHVVAFDRGGAIAVATRLPVRLSLVGGWRDTYLSLPQYGDSSRGLSDSFTGEVYSGNRVPVSPLLDRYPVALLTSA
jgi:(1->4)-alpha-D-glucan 1-alpha-D-glucosylmutase